MACFSPFVAFLKVQDHHDPTRHRWNDGTALKSRRFPPSKTLPFRVKSGIAELHLCDSTHITPASEALRPFPAGDPGRRSVTPPLNDPKMHLLRKRAEPTASQTPRRSGENLETAE